MRFHCIIYDSSECEDDTLMGTNKTIFDTN
jgi:hypothetical protein